MQGVDGTLFLRDSFARAFQSFRHRGTSEVEMEMEMGREMEIEFESGVNETTVLTYLGT